MLTNERQPWWGETELAAGEVGFWRIGPFEFWLTRAESEWRFAGRRSQMADAEKVVREVPAQSPVPEHGVDLRRLGFRQTRGRLHLTPALADRSVVLQPDRPVALPPEEELILYFSSPLWLKVEVGEPLLEFLQLPLQRPSDTWFGPSTREGELCYAVRTSARLSLAEVPVRPHRALTELHVTNLASSPLPVTRVRVPLPTMSLFATATGRLWTQVVTLERHDDGELAELTLGRNPPAHVTDPVLVAGPREAPPRVSLIRAFGGLIGGR